MQKVSSNRAMPTARNFSLPGDVYNATPPRVVFGAGTAERVAEEVRRLNCSRALVVCTAGRKSMADSVVAALGELCVGMLPEAVSQVPIELARRGQTFAREAKADCLVSVGGGASIGLGKGIALELALPIIAIPTTYSGSEMTGFCGITIDGVKRMHQSLNMLAKTVIYDPALTRSLPVKVSAASALNALAHCIDAVYVPTISPMHRLAAAEGARAVVDGIHAVADAPNDLAGRSELLFGAYLAGAALTGGFALQHGLAHTLGGSFGVPHGEAHAVVLPYVTAHNTPFAQAEIAAVGQAMGVSNVAGAIYDLLRELGLPMKLADVGVAQDDIDRVVAITVETDNGLNPAPVTEEATRQLVQAVFEGERPA